MSATTAIIEQEQVQECGDAADAGPGELGPSVSMGVVIAFIVLLPLLLIPMALLFVFSSFRVGRGKQFVDDRSGPVVWPATAPEPRIDSRTIFVEPVQGGMAGTVEKRAGLRFRRPRVARSRVARGRAGRGA